MVAISLFKYTWEIFNVFLCLFKSKGILKIEDGLSAWENQIENTDLPLSPKDKSWLTH